MKMKLASVLFLGGTLVTLAACNNGTKEDRNVSSSEMKTSKESSREMSSSVSSQVESSVTAKAIKNELSVEGSWSAAGKEDQEKSDWNFNNGKLIVNGETNFTYVVSENVDKNGYTVVTISNNDGIAHALLLKKTDTGMDGVTVEDAAYQDYLKNETVPTNQQVIGFTINKATASTWSGIDEAIDFYESTYKNTNNDISKDISWDNYRRDLWSVVADGTTGNKMTLHFTNISGAGGSYTQFIKGPETTEIINFDGNASYPDSPTAKYTVRNSDYVVINTENM
ncbi:hypothetical protein ACWOFR_04780 [Carnobacterium gallinarum]|uniref:hypothetical protein n=1 Tax=Carnobacterium gallinarum TaxID=2749 RepID=UPI000AF5154D|nr:hypothetical protein [Carnobacterium gallinarum]